MLRITPLVFVLVALIGCSSPGAEPPPVPPRPAEATAPPATVPVVPAVTPPVAPPATGEPPAALADGPAPTTAGPAGEAMAAYRAAVDAYDALDEAGYFGAFADPLECFHGEAGHTLAALRASRGFPLEHDGTAALYVVSLTTLRVSADEVVLVDRGIYMEYWAEDRGPSPSPHAYMASSSDAVEQGVHEKVVVMRRTEAGWRIAAETDRAHLNCIVPPVVLDAMPVALDACRSANRDCLRAADETCEACGACNGCNLAPTECLYALAECVGAPGDFAGGNREE